MSGYTLKSTKIGEVARPSSASSCISAGNIVCHLIIRHYGCVEFYTKYNLIVDSKNGLERRRSASIAIVKIFYSLYPYLSLIGR